MGVVRVGYRRGRWPRIDLLLAMVVNTLHARVTAICQAVHHLTTTNSARAASGTVPRSSAMRAKVAAVVQAALLPTNRARHASSATPAIAVAFATATELAQQTAASVALLAAIVTACVVAQAPGSAGHYHRN